MGLSGLTDPLLRTKFCIPRAGDDLVIRSHLTRRLEEGARRRLTLVSALAGFGKTTLFAQWARASGMPVAWLALEDASALLMSGVRVEEAMLDLLVNDLLAEHSGDRALVLDDYHLIGSEEIHRSLWYVVEHLPDTFHLVLAGRAGRRTEQRRSSREMVLQRS